MTLTDDLRANLADVSVAIRDEHGLPATRDALRRMNLTGAALLDEIERLSAAHEHARHTANGEAIEAYVILSRAVDRLIGVQIAHATPPVDEDAARAAAGLPTSDDMPDEHGHVWSGPWCSRCGADEAGSFAAVKCEPDGEDDNPNGYSADDPEIAPDGTPMDPAPAEPEVAQLAAMTVLAEDLNHAGRMVAGDLADANMRALAAKLVIVGDGENYADVAAGLAVLLQLAAEAAAVHGDSDMDGYDIDATHAAMWALGALGDLGGSEDPGDAATRLGKLALAADDTSVLLDRLTLWLVSRDDDPDRRIWADSILRARADLIDAGAHR